MFDNINDAIFVHPPITGKRLEKFTEVNNAACQQLGYTREEMLRMSPQDICPPEIVEQFPAIMDRLWKERRLLFETIHVTKRGSRIPVEINAHLMEFGGETVMLCISRDITARQQAEEELRRAKDELEVRVRERTLDLEAVNQQLRESEARFRTLFQTTGSVILSVDTQDRIQEFNPEAERLTGWPRQEILGKSAVALLIPDEQKDHVIGLRNRVLAGEQIRDLELSLKMKDGNQRLFLWNANPLKDAQGRVTGLIVAGHDITARKEAEKALQAERQRLFSVLDGLPAYIYLLASDHSLAFMNRHFKERFGELDGKAAHQLIHGCQEECKDCPTLKVFETRASQEWEWAGPGGRIYQFYDYPLSDIDGAPMVLEMGIDITARKHAEQALRESETKLRFLTSRMLTAQEVERRRISKELHEELAQSLPTMKLHLKAIKDKLGREQQDLVAECNELLGYFNEVIDYIRRLSQDLSPAILEDLGLVPASKQLLEEFCKKNQLDTCSHDLDEINGLFSPPAEINIYRILQEALTNISKHARATAVSLSIKKQDYKVVVTLEDNGVGFEVGQVLNQAPPDQRVGLTAMAERVRMLGGTLEIWSQVGQGTRISLDIPVDRESIQ